MTDASSIHRLAALGLLRMLLDSLGGVSYGLPRQSADEVSADVYLEDEFVFTISVRRGTS